MKAAVYYVPGGPDVLRFEDVDDPQITSLEVLVQVEAISIEGGDRLHRSEGAADGGPHIVGYQCAGTVVAVGDGVTWLRVGDRVVTVGQDGSHAELRAVPESFCLPVPAGMSIEEAACVPIPFGTADDALFEFGRLRLGETVLVQSGASGVGIAAIQLASRAGAFVLATASRNEKLARLAEFGLDRGINYVEADFVREVRRMTNGRGADVVIDTVGGKTLQGSLQALAYRGRCISIGDSSREREFRLDVSTLRPNNQTLTGYYMGAELFRSDRVQKIVASHLADVAAGRLRVVIDRRFPLSEASAAHAYLESRQAFGRVLLIP